MKKTLAVVLSMSMMLGSFGFISSAEELKEVKFDKVIEAAIKNDKTSEINKKKIELNEQALKDAKEDSEREQYVYSENTYEKESSLRIHLKKPKQKEFELNESKKAYELSVLKNRLDAMKSFKNLYFMEKSLVELENNKTQLEKTLEIEKEKLKLGTTTEKAVRDADLRLKELELTIVKLKRNKEDIIYSIETDTSLDLAKDAKVVNGMSFDKKDIDINIEEVVKEVREKSKSVVSAKHNVEMQKLEIDIKEKGFIKLDSDDPRYEEKPDLDDVNETLLDLEKALKETQDREEINVRRQYNNLLNLKATLKLKELDLESAKENFEITKVRYEQGLINKLMYDAAENQVKSAENGVESAKADLYFGLLDWEYSMKYLEL